MTLLTRIIQRAPFFASCRSLSVGDSRPPSDDLDEFRQLYKNAKHVVVLTGAGVSAESGVPTFKANRHWRKWEAQELATPHKFNENPSLVWEFYHFRRQIVAAKQPNAAHVAIAEAEQLLAAEKKRLVVVTQNVDDLHRRAGTKNIVELHGSLFRTLCTGCGDIAVNKDSPICPALRGKGSPDPEAKDAQIPINQLPSCNKCGGLLRPHVVWFGEGLDYNILNKADREFKNCDLCLVIGTSSAVYPAGMFGPQVASRGIPVAEFNLEITQDTSQYSFHFEGPCGSTLPQALAPI